MKTYCPNVTGSPGCLEDLLQTCKIPCKQASSPSTISKYFKTQPSNDSVSESPYKNCLSKKNSPKAILSDDNDFKTPQPIRKARKPVAKANKTTRGRRRTKTSAQNRLDSFLKVKKPEDCASDVNVEHWQMAVALSKSSYEAENPDCKETNGETSGTQIKSLKATLAEFGFRSGVKRMNVEHKRVQIGEGSKRKKSKFQFVTPILSLRTPEERQALITSKISLILNKNSVNNPEECIGKTHINLCSNILQNLCAAKERMLFYMNQNVSDVSMFYVQELNLDAHYGKCGSLLKNWSEIPGREKSPEPSICLSSPGVDDLNHLGLSPDLFDCSIESPKHLDISQNCHVEDNLNQQEEKANISGIQHYESFHHSPELSQQLYISSDEDTGKQTSSTKSISRNLSKDFYSLTDSDEEIENPSTSLCTSKYIEGSSQINFDLESSKIANVTDYVNNMLNNCCDLEVANLSQQDMDDNEESKSETDACSQDEIICISDEEINYSSIYGTPIHVKQNIESLGSHQKLLLYGIDEGELPESVENLRSQEEDANEQNDVQQILQLDQECDHKDLNQLIPNPLDDSFNIVIQNYNTFSPCSNIPKATLPPNLPSTSLDTPKNKVIKTTNITPYPNYDEMDTPKIVRELSNFGLKPLKRQRATKLLKYIYETTHPLVGEGDRDSSDEDNLEPVLKRQKSESMDKQPKLVSNSLDYCSLDGEDLIFEKKQSTKIQSCAIPMQIVWFNFLVENPLIFENVLLYEPLQLEVLHNMLKEQGYKFDIKDFMTFLDKKCVTYRTNQNQRHRSGKKQPSQKN